MEWIDRLADGLGLEELSGEETVRLLAASREVAHRVERKVTPLAAFLVGLNAGKAMAEGTTRAIAFDEAVDQLLRRLPDAPLEPSKPEDQG